MEGNKHGGVIRRKIKGLIVITRPSQMTQSTVIIFIRSKSTLKKSDVMMVTFCPPPLTLI